MAENKAQLTQQTAEIRPLEISSHLSHFTLCGPFPGDIAGELPPPQSLTWTILCITQRTCSALVPQDTACLVTHCFIMSWAMIPLKSIFLLYIYMYVKAVIKMLTVRILWLKRSEHSQENKLEANANYLLSFFRKKLTCELKLWSLGFDKD